MGPSSSINSLIASSRLADPADAAAAAPAAARSRRREDIGDRYKWNLTDIFAELGRVGSGLQASRSRNREVRGAERHACRRPGPAARGVPPLRNAGTAGVSRLVFPVAALRRGSAGQHRQREAPAGPDPVRPMEAGRVLVQPGAPEDSAGDRARVDGRLRAPAVVSIRDRGPVSPAGARPRRGRRAADVALEPAGLGAERRLLGALHGRREVPDRAALDRRGRNGVVRTGTARSWPRGANRRIAPRRSARCTRRIRTA